MSQTLEAWGEAPGEASGGGTPGRAVWWTLLALVLARALSTFVPSMWAWGLNLQRFLRPLLAWAPWLLMALPLVPRIARDPARRCERIGDLLVARRAAPWVAALIGALLVWVLPDRTWITGDFLLRQGAAETGAFPGNFVQALPLEVWLDQVLPRWFGSLSASDPSRVHRMLGALAAGGLAAVAVSLARDWGLAGSAALVAAATVFFGGYLATFTGLGKPAALMALLLALALLGAGRYVRNGTGGAWLGLPVAIALFLHRSALAFLPLWIVALLLARQRPTGRAPRARLQFLLALAPPLVALAVVTPTLIGILRRYDLPHHLASPEVARRGPLAAALAPIHLADLANLLLLFTPALATAAAAAIAIRRPQAPPWGASRTMLVLASIPALSFVSALLFIHPVQGIFRDLEVFVPAGVALALAAGAILGRSLADHRLPAWLAPALIASVLVPACQWLLLFHEPGSGLLRARRYALEAPARDDPELAQLWDAIAYRSFRLEQWDWAVEAAERSAHYAPHPRALMMLAIARTYTGDARGAESLYVSLADRTPDDPLVWVGLAGSAIRLGDSTQATRALAKLGSYAPEGHEVRLIRRHLRMFPEVWPPDRRTP
jgi:hypothetical protein